MKISSLGKLTLGKLSRKMTLAMLDVGKKYEALDFYDRHRSYFPKDGGGIDPETTKAAKELTAALRDRAKAGTGPFTPVQGEKELIDEKLLNNCDSEAPTCMATIGSGLGAEVLMYGKIEKATQGGQGVYKVSINLLSVPRKQLTASTVETLPVADALMSAVTQAYESSAWDQI